jgi:hypothetical protein
MLWDEVHVGRLCHWFDLFLWRMRWHNNVVSHRAELQQVPEGWHNYPTTFATNSYITFANTFAIFGEVRFRELGEAILWHLEGRDERRVWLDT